MLPANDNHAWWGAAPFARRHLPLVAAVFTLAVVLGAGVAAIFKGDGWPYVVLRSLG